MKTAAERGEHTGCGPEWACSGFGVGNHDYFTCPHCQERFQTFMAAKTSLIRAVHQKGESNDISSDRNTARLSG